METIDTVLALLTGLLVRLAIPILITTLLVILLRQLDIRWQKDAHLPVLAMQRPECWKIKGCPPDQVANCIGAQSPLPCWQAFRLPNRYLQQECLTCKVFKDAPALALKIEPRRL